MSVEAKHIKKGNYILLDQNVFKVVESVEITSHGTHTVKIVLENFVTNHRTTKHFGIDHHIRVLETQSTHYNLVGLLDYSESYQYLSLINKNNGNLEESIYTDNDKLIRYLQDHFNNSNSEDQTLSLTVVKIEVSPLHRTENELNFEKIISVEGFDMKHLHDHHHNHHHSHHNTI